MSRLTSILAIVVAVCGLVPMVPSAAAAQVPEATELGDPFFTYSRPAEFEVVTTTGVRVPLRDGATAVCDLFRPGTSGEPAPGRFPGIVSDYTAYAGRGLGASRYYVERGYNVLVCDARGSGDSAGELDPFGPQEQRDNYDIIEWFAVQPWSDGNIGQTGHSYGAHSSLLVAVNQPPHLRAIVPVMGIHDWYENTVYRGGISSPSIWAWEVTTGPQAAGVANPTSPVTMVQNTTVDYQAHPLHDAFWDERSVMTRWDKLTIPTLAVGGWYDRYRDGMTKNFMARRDIALRDGDPRTAPNVWLVMGPWTHTTPHSAPAPVSTGAFLAFWDHWLKGVRDAPLPRRLVTSYEVPRPGVGTGWQQFHSWPPPKAKAVRLHLTADHTLSAHPGAAGTHSYDVDPFDPGNDRSHTVPVNQDDQREEDQRRLTYTTPPFTEDVVLAGAVEVTLRTAFSAGDGNIVVRLMDVAPDGTSLRISAGWLKASHRLGHEQLAPVQSGTAYDLGVHVWPQHYRFQKGHRLRLSISSGDFPEIAPDAPPGQVTVEAGAGRSFADVPILGRPPAALRSDEPGLRVHGRNGHHSLPGKLDLGG